MTWSFELPYLFFFISDKPEGDQKMNLHFTFSVREISEIRDSDQVLKIPMYFTVTWEVGWKCITKFSVFIFIIFSGKPTYNR